VDSKLLVTMASGATSSNCEGTNSVRIIGASTDVDPKIASFDPAELRQFLLEGGEVGIVLSESPAQQHSDPAHAIGMLCPRRERPRRRVRR
jgi:hypothetical protein